MIRDLITLLVFLIMLGAAALALLGFARIAVALCASQNLWVSAPSMIGTGVLVAAACVFFLRNRE